jgi:anti-sigma factor RsiW
MGERNLQEDEATRYVLGQLPPGTQHEFETQLAQSAELRARVQELEEGMEALARAVPQRPPPPRTWAAIEQAIAPVTQEKIVTPAIWSGWWRNGWTAAAACLIGWLGYALWHQRGAVQAESPSATRTVTVPATPALAPVAHPRAGTESEQDTVAAVAHANRQFESLRHQTAALQTRVQQLTYLVTRQQAILMEPGRFKMFPLANPTAGVAGGNAVPPSPELQRALYYAMARELGWLPATTPGETPNHSAATGSTTNHAGVEFVDLIPPSGHTELQSQEDAESPLEYTAPTSITSTGNIPGFLAGTNLVLAFDSSIATNGSSLSFWINSSAQGYQLVGSTVAGHHPTVVTVPTAATPGWNLTVTAGPASGASNVIGQFSSP